MLIADSIPVKKTVSYSTSNIKKENLRSQNYSPCLLNLKKALNFETITTKEVEKTYSTGHADATKRKSDSRSLRACSGLHSPQVISKFSSNIWQANITLYLFSTLWENLNLNYCQVRWRNSMTFNGVVYDPRIIFDHRIFWGRIA